MAKDEVDWPELTEHRQRIDEELKQQKAAHEPDLVQVWFTGVHINVGGGTDEAKTDFEGKLQHAADQSAFSSRLDFLGPCPCVERASF